MVDEVVVVPEQAPATGTETTPVVTGTGAGTAGFEGEFTPERARGTIDTLRQSEKALKEQNRLRNEELVATRAKVKEYEDAKLSADERLTRDLTERTERLTTAQQRIRTMSIQNEVLAESVALNLVDPRAAAKLLDESALTFDPETGMATNVREVLDKLLVASPWLRNTAAAPQTPPNNQPPLPPAGNPPREGTDKTTFHEDQLKDHAFFEANRPAIMQALKEGRIQASGPR